MRDVKENEKRRLWEGNKKLCYSTFSSFLFLVFKQILFFFIGSFTNHCFVTIFKTLCCIFYDGLKFYLFFCVGIFINNSIFVVFPRLALLRHSNWNQCPSSWTQHNNKKYFKSQNIKYNKQNLKQNRFKHKTKLKIHTP